MTEEPRETCRTCREPYSGYGDGWNGECPNCADRTFAKGRVLSIVIEFDTQENYNEFMREHDRTDIGRTCADVSPWNSYRVTTPAREQS